MKQKTYIETTIPSFYFEIRNDPEMIAMREWTKSWWDNQRHHYELVTSIPVIEELENGDHPSKQKTIELISKTPILPIHEEIEEIVDEYINQHIMPNDPKGDALHLALASYHQCHFLLTWNCSHLANANKFEHIRHINTMLGLYVPILTTPFELLHWEEV
jgi:predicted nucleic acid-binding protein